MEYRIGEFSRITMISVKALRYYHDEGLLEPSRIDWDSNYRYYDESCFAPALMIKQLRDLDFSILQVRGLLSDGSEEDRLFSLLESKSSELDSRINQLAEIRDRIEKIISTEKQEQPLPQKTVNTINLKKQRIASIRFTGKYSQTGVILTELYSKIGASARGGPFTLYWDDEYKDEKSDIEACIPVSDSLKSNGFEIRTIKERQAVSIIHVGPYDELGRSYKKLFDYISSRNLKLEMPIEEHYLKGPGMFIKRNPQKFQTRLCFHVS